jgi:tetratricopeptide (TPR) repeat protein
MHFMAPLRYAGLATLALLSACASAGPRVLAPPPEAAPQLRLALATDPDNADLSWRLAAALRSGDQRVEAADVLDSALSTNPSHAPSVHLRGVMLEEAGDDAGALAAYERFLTLDDVDALVPDVRRRVTLLRRRLVEARVRAALDDEAALSDTDPVPGTVGIFPFVYTGAAEELASLGRALTHMLVTDLAATERLSVLERLQVQLIADEITLTERGLIEAETGVRGGRLLQAERIVQGQIGGDDARLALGAGVLESTAVGADPTRVEVDDALDRFFEAEGRLALGLFEAMGIELTAAERELVGRRRTANLQALLAFGTGLEAQDSGRFSDAREAFQRAVSLDPDFEDAREALQEATDLEEAEDDDLDEFAALGGDLLRPSPWELWLDRRGTYLPIEEIIPDVGGRDPWEEIGGEPISPQSGTVIIVIPRPGGGR